MNADNEAPEPHPGAPLAAAFAIGAIAVTGQVVGTRELLTGFFGNELCLGVILGAWLFWAGCGAALARLGLTRPAANAAPRRRLGVILAALAVTGPLLLAAARSVRVLTRTPPGEYAPLGALAIGASLALIPVCLPVGFAFPHVCAALSRRDPDAGARNVARAYGMEALGAGLAGAALTFVLIPAFDALPVILLASALGLAVSASFAARPVLRACARLAALILAAAALLNPPLIRALDHATLAARRRDLGITKTDGAPESDAAGPAVRLAASVRGLYEDLTVTESAGQYVLYGSGRVRFAFPDPLEYEHAIHSIMAQNPAARRVLLLGGNPVGDLPELLKYPLERLVYVELDPAVGEIVRRVVPDAYRQAVSDPRLFRAVEDAVRYVRRCDERFDAILLNAPDPVTAGANRFHTVEFYRAVRRLLAPGGFVVTAVTASERLQSEALPLAASVYRTLRAVFPIVQVTAEARYRFFAGAGDGAAAGAPPLTLEPAALAARSRAAAIPARYFQPDYLLGADEFDPEKTRAVAERLASADAPLNTLTRPAAYFYNLILWSEYSGSSVAAVLRGVSGRRFGRGAIVLLALVPLAALAAALARRRRPDAARSVAGAVALFALLGGGFCAMSLQMVLIVLFQSLYGYVYSRIGLVFAAFMFGLVAGARLGARLATVRGQRAWIGPAAIEAAFALLALSVPALAHAGAAAGPAFETLVYAAVAATGCLAGALFPACVRLRVAAGARPDKAAAVATVSENLGAALGAVATGSLLLPLVGMVAIGRWIALIKLAAVLGFLAVGLAHVLRPSRAAISIDARPHA